MAFCRLVFPFLVLSVLGSAFAQVPVYIWGDLDARSTKYSPLMTLSESKFKGILKQELADNKFTVIFMDVTLSIEDLARRNAEGVTSFPYLLSQSDKGLYLPSVDNSLTVLYELADPEEVNHVKLTENGLSAEIIPNSGKFLFIELKDANEGESRSTLLKRHNDFIQKTVEELRKQHEQLVAIYTAEYPSWVLPDMPDEVHNRVRRAARVDNDDFIMSGLRLYANRILLTDGSSNGTYLQGFTGYKSTFAEGTMTTEMTFTDNILTLNFTQNLGYWYFNTVTVQQSSPRQFTHELLPKSDVFAVMGFSYRCGQNISFANINETETVTLTFQNLKIQPFFKETNASDTLVFGDSVNCVGFFSAPIWSGIFVVFILLSITFFGIMMMMDIRTMDRFDDPKGKTITINAGE